MPKQRERCLIPAKLPSCVEVNNTLLESSIPGDNSYLHLVEKINPDHVIQTKNR
jgi:hypothetical protein